MKYTYKILIGVIILILATFLFINNKNNANTADIKIGAVLSLTGFGSSDSENIKNGMELAKEDLLKKGINVSIDYQDDKTDPKETVNAVRLLASKNPDAIIGPVWSYLVDAGSQSIENSKIATYSPSVTSEYVSSRAENIFRGAVKNSQATNEIVKRLKEDNITTVAIITTNGAWGDSLLSVFKDSSLKAGTSVVLNERVDFGNEPTTIPTIVTKVKASKAQAILWTGSEDGAMTLIKKMNEQGLNIPIIGTNALDIVIKKGLVSKGNLKIYFTDSIKSTEFTKKFKAKYGKENGSYSEEAYDGIMMIAEAKINKGSNETISDYLRNKTNYSGYAGKYKFDENGDRTGGKWALTEIK